MRPGPRGRGHCSLSGHWTFPGFRGLHPQLHGTGTAPAPRVLPLGASDTVHPVRTSEGPLMGSQLPPQPLEPRAGQLGRKEQRGLREEGVWRGAHRPWRSHAGLQVLPGSSHLFN